jgi:hypothetical protein
MWEAGKTKAPAYTARRSFVFCARLRLRSQAGALARLYAEPEVVVLVPVLKRRASVELRHGHLLLLTHGEADDPSPD